MPTNATVPFLEITAPVRLAGQSDVETVFTWMVTNRYLWMLDGKWADRVETLVGTGRLINLVGKRRRFARKSPEHPAFDLPDEDSREHAYRRLESLLKMHISLGSALDDTDSND